MEPEAKFHSHPVLRYDFSAVIHGHRLQPGDVIEEGDKCDSSVGSWTTDPTRVGSVLREGERAGECWVRPSIARLPPDYPEGMLDPDPPQRPDWWPQYRR